VSTVNVALDDAVFPARSVTVRTISWSPSARPVRTADTFPPSYVWVV